MIFTSLLYFSLQMSLQVTPPAFAQSPACEPQAKLTVVKKIRAPQGVNYFLRGAPATKEIGFATNMKGNVLLDEKTGKFSAVGGNYDPVPSPDGAFFTAPGDVIYRGKTPLKPGKRDGSDEVDYRYEADDGSVSKRHGETFLYDLTPLTLTDLQKKNATYSARAMVFYTKSKSNPGQYELNYSDEQVTAAYQSLGMTSTPEGPHYRMLFEDQKNIMFKEYTLDSKSGKIRPLGPAKALCKTESGLNSALPMISKDGKEFSVYDPQSHSTKIYSVDTCAITDEIHALVGKIDFSPDRRWLAFHIDQSNKIGLGFFKTPDEDAYDLNLFLYDRDSKKLIPLKSEKNTDTYYPIFLSNNEIAYVSKGKADKNFYIIAAKINFSESTSCQSQSPRPTSGTR